MIERLVFGPKYALALICAGLALSCHNLDGFTTKPGYAYCGQIVGTQALDFQTGFVAEGQPPTLSIALSLDTDKLTSLPGILTSNDADNGLCSSTGQPLFQDAPLRAIPEVDHDALSTLSFGDGHVHDFFAWVDSTCQGTLVAVVSLMKDNQVELRLFKPMRLPPPDAGPAATPGFAMFSLTARKRSVPGESAEAFKESCGF
ncbi:MAG TPA: hypothetical protein VGM44_15345 [Polyangiaceae bacterium]|jgi:hypothetical protein